MDSITTGISTSTSSSPPPSFSTATISTSPQHQSNVPLVASSHHQIPGSESRQPTKRRARVACKRCRRLRKKCLHDDAEQEGKAPCIGCRESGFAIASQCRFPTRGEPDLDREYRRRKQDHAHPEERERQHSVSVSGTVNSGSASESPGSSARFSAGVIGASLDTTSSTTTSNIYTNNTLSQPTQDRWSLLPPHNELIEAVKVFHTSFFQLGFIPKSLFLEQLSSHKSTINVFYLLSILSVSARFTTSLINRYGDGLRAAEVFMERAARLVPEEMYTPTLDRTQGFFLLAIAEWGKGDKTSSGIHMGIAVRMAGMLRLHREETYAMPANHTAEDVINSEMARRTFWMLESQDNLHSGYTTPTSFSLSDITTLLPCEERDFAFGVVIPIEKRTALAGTLAAARNPETVHTPSRSLFATLIQAHNLWGQVARRAVASGDPSSAGERFPPWDSRSDYASLLLSLQVWETHLPTQHKWSIWNFRGYTAEGLDLAYLSVVMVIRLSNIILRRTFIDSILHHPTTSHIPSTSDPTTPPPPPHFWTQMSHSLFSNVLALHEQIDAFFSLRSPQQGFPAMIVFCVYVCGSLANHLWRRPEICPGLSAGMGEVVKKSLEVLMDLQHAWPLARSWRKALECRARVVRDEVGERGKNETLLMSNVTNSGGEEMGNGMVHEGEEGFEELLSGNDGDGDNGNGGVDGGVNATNSGEGFDWDPSQELNAGFFPQTSPADDIEAQLAAFLQVQGQLGIFYD